MTRYIYIIILMLLPFLQARAGEKTQSALDYYNEGVVLYKACDYPHAILSFEKALKLDPTNRDIQHNLELTRVKTEDKIPEPGQMFFVRWYKGFVMLFSIDAWAILSIVTLSLALIALLLFLFLNPVAIRRISFYSAVVCLLLCFLSFLMAWQRKYLLTTYDTAIVVAKETKIQNNPTAKAPVTKTIHEGTKVYIDDRDMKGWLGIHLSDGHEGWIKANTVEEI